MTRDDQGKLGMTGMTRGYYKRLGRTRDDWDN